jgi:hypothetical protein
MRMIYRAMAVALLLTVVGAWRHYPLHSLKSAQRGELQAR